MQPEEVRVPCRAEELASMEPEEVRVSDDTLRRSSTHNYCIETL